MYFFLSYCMLNTYLRTEISFKASKFPHQFQSIISHFSITNYNDCIWLNLTRVDLIYLELSINCLSWTCSVYAPNTTTCPVTAIATTFKAFVTPTCATKPVTSVGPSYFSCPDNCKSYLKTKKNILLYLFWVDLFTLSLLLFLLSICFHNINNWYLILIFNLQLSCNLAQDSIKHVSIPTPH